MPALWRDKLRPQVQSLYPGLLATLVTAIAATFLGQHYGAPVMLFALLLGMVLNFLSQENACRAGIELASRQVLRIGIALLGLRITTHQLTALGWEPVLMVISGLVVTIGVGFIAARAMGFNKFFGFLSGGAVGICGASAAMAISAVLPTHPLRERATLFTVICVSVFSTLAMIVYPLIAKAIGLSPVNAGVFLGATIHDVAQVVGAGYAMSTATGDVAVVVKLLRVGMLLPVIVVASWLTRRHGIAETGETGERPPILPSFAIAFLVLVMINSTGFLPSAIIEAGSNTSRWCLVMAIAAIGMKTHLRDIVTVGWRPVALVFLETSVLAIFTLIWLHVKTANA
jgi:uncharacterized integral membrane protein (TIGR00698 family)